MFRHYITEAAPLRPEVRCPTGWKEGKRHKNSCISARGWYNELGQQKMRQLAGAGNTRKPEQVGKHLQAAIRPRRASIIRPFPSFSKGENGCFVATRKRILGVTIRFGASCRVKPARRFFVLPLAGRRGEGFPSPRSPAEITRSIVIHTVAQGEERVKIFSANIKPIGGFPAL